MNKIFNINLGGYPFTIDDDAYHGLDDYLDAIRGHFAGSEGCDDIIADIEIRIAELFNEHLKGQPIVSMREVDKVISVMGRPEDFAGGTEDESAAKHTKRTSHSSESRGHKVGRRLFRDPDEKVIGGVCSGIAAYVGIDEPLWIRLIFLLSFFGGVGVLLYPILWVAIPEARTSSDKLAMKGEKIDVHNIARKVEEEINNISDTINQMAKDFGSKKKH